MNDIPAFPRPFSSHGNFPIKEQIGMGLRDWFAGQAIVGNGVADFATVEDAADWAFRLADAMLKRRDS